MRNRNNIASYGNKGTKGIRVEIVPQAIEDAKNNALRNSLNNAEFFVGKAEEVVPRIYDEDMKKAENEPVDSKESSGLSDSASVESVMRINPDVVVVDPPRKGCDETLLDTIVKMNPKRIVYVSCDSATLARDLKYLAANGYKIARVQPVDQFAHTVHVENVVKLVRKTSDAYIDLKVDMDKLDLTASEAKATYEKIKQYILDKYDTKVTNLYIAQVKDKYGIIERENYNKPKSADVRQPHCQLEKVEMIEEALRYFRMI